MPSGYNDTYNEHIHTFTSQASSVYEELNEDLSRLSLNSEPTTFTPRRDLQQDNIEGNPIAVVGSRRIGLSKATHISLPHTEGSLN